MDEAKAALSAWGEGRIVRFLKDRENAVFEVVLPGAGRAALRLHRPGYQSVAAIRSELWWMQALASAGLPVPMPLATVTGDLVFEGPGRVATVISWLEGEVLGDVGVPLNGSVQDQCARFDRIGRLLAEMHNVTDRLDLPEGFDRPHWDAEGLLGEGPVWGRFWGSPALAEDEREVVLEAREKAKEAMYGFALFGDFGLIHADVLRENVLFSGETVSIIDFDDCGFGFRMYDFASLASQNEEEPAYDQLMAAAFDGYRHVRELSQVEAELLPLFVMLRRFASMGWVVDRTPDGDPRRRVYAERAVRAARRFLGAAAV